MTYCYSVYHSNFRDSTGQCTGIHRRITGSSPGRTAVRASQGIGFASLRVLDRLVRLCKPVIKAAMPPFANENQLRSKTFLIFQPNYNRNKRSSQCDYERKSKHSKCSYTWVVSRVMRKFALVSGRNLLQGGGLTAPWLHYSRQGAKGQGRRYAARLALDALRTGCYHPA